MSIMTRPSSSRLALVAIFLLLIPGLAHAVNFGLPVPTPQTTPVPSRTFYVDKNNKGGPCNDSNSIAQAQNITTPWCTLRKAARNVEPGDLVYVRGERPRTTRSTPPGSATERTARGSRARAPPFSTLTSTGAPQNRSSTKPAPGTVRSPRSIRPEPPIPSAELGCSSASARSAPSWELVRPETALGRIASSMPIVLAAREMYRRMTSTRGSTASDFRIGASLTTRARERDREFAQ